MSDARPEVIDALAAGGVLRAHPLPRFGILLPAGVCVGASLAAWAAEPDDARALIAVVVMGVCGYATVRWIVFAGARRRGEQLLVTGLLWSRRIPLERVERVVEGWAFVLWRNRWGVRVVTPLTPLWSEPNAVESVSRHNRRRLAAIRRWAKEVHPSLATST